VADPGGQPPLILQPSSAPERSRRKSQTHHSEATKMHCTVQTSNNLHLFSTSCFKFQPTPNPISRCETKLVVTQPKSQSAKATSPICRHTRNHNTTYTTAGLGRPKRKEPNELDRMNKIEYNHTPPTNNSTFEPTNITCIPLSP